MSQVSRGFFWSAVERFSLQGIGFLLSIIIARLVSPNAYGLIVMIQVFISFSSLFVDSGFGNALIQKKNCSDKDYNTVFIFNIVVSSILYFILFFSAQFIADFYDEPQLIPLTRVVALSLIISSLGMVQYTRLVRALDFKTTTKTGLISMIISGIIGIYCAYSGLEVWALVIQNFAAQIINTILVICYTRWFPKIQFSKDSFFSMFNFGSKLFAANILTNIYINIYNLLIGKKYSSSDLAFYNRGFTLSQFPSVNVAGVMTKVIFPVLSKFQDDKENLLSAYNKYLHLSHFVILPLLCLLLVLSKPLILILLTSKWLPAVPYLQIFCVNFMIYPFIQQSSLPVAAIGHSGILLKYQFLKRFVSLILLLLTIGYGPIIISWGIVVGSLFEAFVNLSINKRELGTSIFFQLRSQVDVFVAVVIMGLAVYGFMLLIQNEYVQLFGGGVLGFAVFVSLSFLLKIRERVYIPLIYLKLKNIMHNIR